jgi:hypothetical protein
MLNLVKKNGNKYIAIELKILDAVFSAWVKVHDSEKNFLPHKAFTGSILCEKMIFSSHGHYRALKTAYFCR